jgi:prepilin signal peptidase PulO-like enzyme (type II secretory pathway)
MGGLMPVEYYYFLLMTFILGSVIGSFLNVCIYRIPEGISIVSPRSRCPQCGTPIRWYHNIPILSWLFLKGRCAYCGVKVSARYLLVEALTGGLFALFFSCGVKSCGVKSLMLTNLGLPGRKGYGQTITYSICRCCVSCYVPGKRPAGNFS